MESGNEAKKIDKAKQQALAGIKKDTIRGIISDRFADFIGTKPDLHKAVQKLDTAYNKYFPENTITYMSALTKVIDGKNVLKEPSELLQIEETTKDKIISDISGNPAFIASIDELLSKPQSDIRNNIIAKVVKSVDGNKSSAGGFRTVRASRRLKKHKRSHKAKRTGKGKKTKKHGKRRASKTRKH